MRAVVDLEEDRSGRTLLVVTQLPHLVNPDNLALKIAELVNAGKLNGIADIRDDTSARTGQRLVIVLKRDAQPRVVLNNLYKHTQLQDTFGCNMLALVDDVPRTLRLDQFLSYWIVHQIEVIQRRTRHRLDDAQARAHIYRGLVKALDALDEVIALIRRSPSTDDAREGLKTLLEIDDLQANAILDMQLRRLAALERQRIIDQLAEYERIIADLQDILDKPERQRRIISTELAEIVDKYGDDRRTEIIAADGDLSNEDLIPDADVVVTITRGGYAKRTNTDQYRVQRRGGRCAGRRCGPMTWSSTCSQRPITSGSCSSPTRAGSIAPRRGSYRRPAATPRAVTWPACCRSFRRRRSHRCWRSATMPRIRTSCWPRSGGW